MRQAVLQLRGTASLWTRTWKCMWRLCPGSRAGPHEVSQRAYCCKPRGASAAAQAPAPTSAIWRRRRGRGWRTAAVPEAPCQTGVTLAPRRPGNAAGPPTTPRQLIWPLLRLHRQWRGRPPAGGRVRAGTAGPRLRQGFCKRTPLPAGDLQAVYRSPPLIGNCERQPCVISSSHLLCAATHSTADRVYREQ